jgi:hypothetical protein
VRVARLQLSRTYAETGSAAGGSAKLSDCYLGLLYSMDDVAVFGYLTASKVKIVLAFALSDAMIRDADVTMVCDLIWEAEK